uniref:Uncharacterized protein n=1 Tax=Oryza brachyantha TaxID=4533 RepID=J3N139_ORYBR
MAVQELPRQRLQVAAAVAAVVVAASAAGRAIAHPVVGVLVVVVLMLEYPGPQGLRHRQRVEEDGKTTATRKKVSEYLVLEVEDVGDAAVDGVAEAGLGLVADGDDGVEAAVII